MFDVMWSDIRKENMKRGSILCMVLLVCIAFSQIEEIPAAAQEAVVEPDVVEDVQNDKFTAYEQNKITIKVGSQTYESIDEWFILRAVRFRTSVLYADAYWKAYKGGQQLKEDEFFEITGFPEKARRTRDLKTTYRIMKWSSPFLILGGVLMSGVSSRWGSGETNTFTPIGVGISVLGMIAGVEGLSKGSRNVYGMEDAIPAMSSYNERLKDSLGIVDTFEQTSAIQSIIDTWGIEVVPYQELDEGLTPVPSFDSLKIPPGIPHVFTKMIVVVVALIDTTGNVIACDIHKTSGSKLLDSQALRIMQKEKFTIPRKDGKAVFTKVSRPLIFKPRID